MQTQFTILAQASPWEYGAPMDQAPGVSIGQLALLLFFALALNLLFGWWAKRRAEDHGVNPWAGFAAGFFLGWIGVLIVPMLRSDRIFNKRQPNAAAFAQSFNGQYPPGVQPYGSLPPPPADMPAPEYVPPPQPAMVVDKDGYFQCPGCGARAKAGRRSCMSCGAMFSPAAT